VTGLLWIPGGERCGTTGLRPIPVGEAHGTPRYQGGRRGTGGAEAGRRRAVIRHRPVPAGKIKLERGHFPQSNRISPERNGRRWIEDMVFFLFVWNGLIICLIICLHGERVKGRERELVSARAVSPRRAMRAGGGGDGLSHLPPRVARGRSWGGGGVCRGGVESAHPQ
jgi:hypothetical protein